MTAIKICGIRRPEHALIAAEEGVDFVGVIFAPMSSRAVTLAEAQAVRSALDRYVPLERRPRLVGVFVNEVPERMNRIAEQCGLDLLQLHGDEPWSLCRALLRPAIKALRVAADADPGRLMDDLERELPPLLAGGGHCLMESQVAGRYGGTGQQMNWMLASAVAKQHPFILSGGLGVETVAGAVASVRPWGVDVSSGVETSGVKDPGKIRAFVRAVHRADGEGAASRAATNRSTRPCFEE